MYEEIKTTVDWIVSLVMIRSDYVYNNVATLNDRRNVIPSPYSISDDQMRHFEVELLRSLMDSYKGAWSNSNPTRHQAYRAIHVSPQSPVNQFIKQAADSVGITYDWLGLNNLTFTIWTDPGKVTVRFNDHDAMQVIYISENRRRRRA